MTISAFRSGDEFIEITREHNNLYYIHYGIGYSKNTGNKYSNCFAGGFTKYSDAINALKKHRPKAEQIKDYCLKCKKRQMLTYDFEKGEAIFEHCNGALYTECYTDCIYRGLK